MSSSPAHNDNAEKLEGAEYAVQTLYEGRPKCSCCKNWVEDFPKDLHVKIESQPEVKRKALVVRMRRNHDGGEGDGEPLALDSIVVQSSSLKATLSELFEGYEGITPSLKKVVFRSPFRPFYYRWKHFGHILDRQKRHDPTAATYTQLLYNILSNNFGSTIAEIDDHASHGVITHSQLWALFEPGTRVIAKEGHDERFFIVDVHFLFLFLLRSNLVYAYFRYLLTDCESHTLPDKDNSSKENAEDHRETEQDKVYFWKTLKVNQVPEHVQKLSITPSLSDELTPVSGGRRDTFGDWTESLVDSLDTLWVMDMKDEFSDAVAAAVTIDFTKTDWKRPTSLRRKFDLGGFLSAFDLSSDL
ncbi:AAA protein [Colletotrichum tofieldiae]|nr:AAA protein [Colletotrichum tofieldiae]